MSRDMDGDERRLYDCTRKYDIIVKQFDELIEIMNNTTPIPKWKRTRANLSGVTTNPGQHEALAEKVTRFLNELRLES